MKKPKATPGWDEALADGRFRAMLGRGVDHPMISDILTLHEAVNELEKPIRHAVLGLLIQDNEIWAISRIGKHEDLGFPGGKKDPGETEVAALVREIREELGIRVKRCQRVFGCVDSDKTWSVTFLVSEWEGEPHDQEQRGAVVVRVPPGRLVENSCSYQAYNRALFAHLGVRLPG